MRPEPGVPAFAAGGEQPAPAGTTDGDLVRSTLAGDRRAFDNLVRRYQRQAVSLAYQRLGNPDDAQEVAQDAFIKAYTGLKTLQTPEAFGGWLLRTVSNLALNFRRGRRLRRNPGLEESLTAGDANPAAGGIQSDDAIRLQGASRSAEDHELRSRREAAMAALPEKQRRAIEMFAIEGLSQKEVAEQLKCSVEAVKWYVFQGRKTLRESLKDVL